MIIQATALENHFYIHLWRTRLARSGQNWTGNYGLALLLYYSLYCCTAVLSFWAARLLGC